MTEKGGRKNLPDGWSTPGQVADGGEANRRSLLGRLARLNRFPACRLEKEIAGAAALSIHRLRL